LTDEQILSIMSAAEKRCVMYLGKANMNVSKASRLAHMSRQGFLYRIKCVRNNTGFNPLDFHDLTRLVHAIEEERKEYDRLFKSQ
jgi:hypothetical protein